MNTNTPHNGSTTAHWATCQVGLWEAVSSLALPEPFSPNILNHRKSEHINHSSFWERFTLPPKIPLHPSPSPRLSTTLAVLGSVHKRGSFLPQGSPPTALPSPVLPQAGTFSEVQTPLKSASSAGPSWGQAPTPLVYFPLKQSKLPCQFTCMATSLLLEGEFLEGEALYGFLTTVSGHGI